MSDQLNQSSLKKPKKKPGLIAVGVVLIIIGISWRVAPYNPVITTNSMVLFDQTFQVPGFHYYYFSGEFYTPDNVLHINFDLAGQGVIDFLVLDEANFMKFNSSSQFERYAPSADMVAVKDADWNPPVGTVYFIWDNSESPNSQTVSALFKTEYQGPLAAPIFLRLGFLMGLSLLLLGLAVMVWGFRPPIDVTSKGTLIAGYIFAVLGGLIGLIFGLILVEKANPEEKWHGKAILSIGFLAIALYVVTILEIDFLVLS